MFKNLLLAVPVILLVAAQCWFIYGIGGDAAKEFLSLWRSFGVVQTDYSKFVFSTINFWWVLPITCLLGLIIPLYYSVKKFAFIALIFTVFGTVALYWSVYSPAMMLKIWPNKAIKSDIKQLAFVRASQILANFFLPFIAALVFAL